MVDEAYAGVRSAWRARLTLVTIPRATCLCCGGCWATTLAQLGTEGPDGMTRSLLHVATDWRGYYLNGVATVIALVEAGADVHVRFTGPHTETPLHWAASSDDIAVLDVLLDAGPTSRSAAAAQVLAARRDHLTDYRAGEHPPHHHHRLLAV
jgi:Ankyrin repeat